MAKGGVLQREGETSLLLAGKGLAATGGASKFGTTGPPVFQGDEHHHHHHHHHGVTSGLIERNPVEQLCKKSLLGFGLFLLFSFLGILFLILRWLGFDELPFFSKLPPVAKTYWAVFGPFWFADLAAIATLLEVLVGTCTLRTTTRDEKRNIAR